MSSKIVPLLSLIVIRRNGATLDRKTLEAAELSLKSKRKYERFGSMNELRKNGTEKIILLFPSAVYGPTPDVGRRVLRVVLTPSIMDIISRETRPAGTAPGMLVVCTII
jgi:hypothetical protein